MSAKITVIVYIVISFEIGILLLILPWSPWWQENFFLYFITGKLHAPWIATLLTNKAVRGAVTGIGILNILAGAYEIFKFRDSVNQLTSMDGSPAKQSGATDDSVAVSDHQPTSFPPQS
ncbi:MAG: hypothetical protein ACKVZH_00535 [Blastocatellia bacterium]